MVFTTVWMNSSTQLFSLRQQVSSIRQFLEWWGVRFVEARKDGLPVAWRESIENVKQELIREGVREGTLTEQQVQEFFQNADGEEDDTGRDSIAESNGREYRVQTRRGDHWMSIWRGFSHDPAVRVCRWGQKQHREVRIV